jgi:hypothetical protein
MTKTEQKGRLQARILGLDVRDVHSAKQNDCANACLLYMFYETLTREMRPIDNKDGDGGYHVNALPFLEGKGRRDRGGLKVHHVNLRRGGAGQR